MTNAKHTPEELARARDYVKRSLALESRYDDEIARAIWEIDHSDWDNLLPVQLALLAIRETTERNAVIADEEGGKHLGQHARKACFRISADIRNSLKGQTDDHPRD